MFKMRDIITPLLALHITLISSPSYHSHFSQHAARACAFGGAFAGAERQLSVSAVRSKCAPAGSIRSPSRPLARNLPTRVRHSSTVCYSAGRRQLSPTRDHTAHGDVLVCLRWPAHDSSINVVVLPAISGAEPPSDAHVQVVPTKVGGARTTCPRPVLNHLHPAVTELFKSTRTRIAKGHWIILSAVCRYPPAPCEDRSALLHPHLSLMQCRGTLSQP